jgi:hypothetical protein
MDNIKLRGIGPSTHDDDRTLLIIEVTLEGETLEWEYRIPPSIKSNFDDYLQSKANDIFTDIQTKKAEWELLTPKTREISLPGKETITVPIERNEIVKPTYPDYYVLRAREYPPLKDQLDAIFKGGAELQNMQDLVQSIKSKYPKN